MPDTGHVVDTTKKRYVNESAILGKLISMLVRRYHTRDWTMGPEVMAAHLKEMGITPERSDAEIELEIERLVDSGDLVHTQTEEEAEAEDAAD